MCEVTHDASPEHSGATARQMPWGEALALTGILLVGALLRLAYLHELTLSPYFSLPPVDPAFHDDWARALTGLYPADAVPGQYGPGQPADDPYMRPPGYPYFLALVYLLTRGSYLGAYATQMGLGLVNVVLAFLLARRLFGRIPAFLAAAGMASYWSLIYNEGELHAVVLLIFLTLVLFLLLERWLSTREVIWACASGAVMAPVVLTGPVVLTFVPVVVSWMAILEWRRVRSRRFLIAPAVFAAVYGLALLPAQVRNYRAAGEWEIVTSAGGTNFFIGNNPKATGVFSWDYSEYGMNGSCYECIAMRRVLSNKLGRDMSWRDISAFFRGKALDYIRENPTAALRLTLKKALLFWGPVELRHNKAVEEDRAHSPVLRGIPGSFPLVFSLFLLGSVVFTFRRRSGPREEAERGNSALVLLVLAYIAVYFLSYVPFFVNAQFRAPLTPFLILLAAYGVCRTGELALARRYGLTAAAFAGVVVLYAACSYRVVPYDPKEDRVFWHLDRGFTFTKLGRSADAIAEYRATLTVDPLCYGAYTGLAHELAIVGQYDQALEVCESARTHGKKFDWTLFDTGVAFLRPLANQTDDAFVKAPAEWPGVALTESTAPLPPTIAFGIRSLDRFVEVCPEGRAAAYQTLAKAYVALGRYDEAAGLYGKTLEVCPQCQTERSQGAALVRALERPPDAAQIVNDGKPAIPSGS